jgi:ATP-dependent Clp protease ATP-binding subunit ClpA
MTSNVSSELFQETRHLGFQTSRRDAEAIARELRGHLLDALRRTFRPEFLNRVDEIIIFHPLSREHLERIVDIQVANLKKRLAERKIDVVLTSAAKRRLADEGFDPVYGARPLRRTIQRQVLDPLALKVLQGEFREGDTVIVDVEEGNLVFRQEAKAAVA